MKTIFSIFIILFSKQLFATDNLSHMDRIGTWAFAWTGIDGENQVLTISEDKSSIFERNYEDADKQIFKSNNMEYFDDLLIIKYNDSKGLLNYKLVLSGWHSYGVYRPYGTLYMYNKGALYNGLTVSFQRSD